MFNFKKVFIILFFSIFLFFNFIPKASAKYAFLGDISFSFEIENGEIQEEIENPFRIYTIEDLLRFQDLQNTGKMDFEDVDVYLMNDIDLSSVSRWFPIGTAEYPFKGTFHGEFHTISGFNLVVINDSKGFFGQNNGVIENFTIIGQINAHVCSNIGGIVGTNYGTIRNSNSKVDITGSGRNIGGIAGLSDGGTIEHCINYNSISGEEYSGGICGYSKNTLIKCCGNEENANIENTYGYSGGIVRIY